MIDISKTYPRVRHCRCLKTPPGTTWGPRKISDLEIILITNGTFQYVATEGIISVKTGDILIVEPDKEHIFMCKDGNPEGIHICAHFDLLDISGKPCLVNQLDSSLKRCISTENFEYTKMLFEQAALDFANYSKFHTDIVNATVRVIWLQVIKKSAAKLTEEMSHSLLKMVNYVRNNFTKPITRQDIAILMDYSPEHVNYIFKKELGISPSKFINRERVIHAFNLICQEDVSIEQAAKNSGFSSVYYFSRVFKGIFGHPPGRIKKYMHREINHYLGTYKPT